MQHKTLPSVHDDPLHCLNNDMIVLINHRVMVSAHAAQTHWALCLRASPKFGCRLVQWTVQKCMDDLPEMYGLAPVLSTLDAADDRSVGVTVKKACVSAKSVKCSYI